MCGIIKKNPFYILEQMNLKRVSKEIEVLIMVKRRSSF